MSGLTTSSTIIHAMLLLSLVIYMYIPYNKLYNLKLENGVFISCIIIHKKNTDKLETEKNTRKGFNIAVIIVSILSIIPLSFFFIMRRHGLLHIESLLKERRKFEETGKWDIKL